jgi:hypothetical protein
VLVRGVGAARNGTGSPVASAANRSSASLSAANRSAGSGAIIRSIVAASSAGTAVFTIAADGGGPARFARS